MACDPYGSSVVLALHCDGTNGGTTFTDEIGNTITPTNCTTSTVAYKYGTASALFNGAAYLSVPDTTALEFGSENLTIEFWVNTSQTTQYATLISRTPATFASGMFILMLNVTASSGFLSFWAGDYSTGSPLMTSITTSVINSAWHHIAVTRNGSAWNIWVDGTSRASATWAGTIANIAGGMRVGNDQNYGRYYNGYIDDLRITKGVARYTADFTPDTSTFASNQCVISGVVRDSANAYAERLVRVYRRDTGALFGQAVSNATTGAYSVNATITGECFALVHDSSANPPSGGTENAIILDRLVPA